MKIYTKTGDNGTTGLYAGPRVSKDHPRIRAYGTVDELNAILGAVLPFISPTESANSRGLPENSTASPAREISDQIKEIQSDLFSIGAQLATPEPEKHQMCLLESERVAVLEGHIDRYEQELEPLQTFILPGGSLGSAMLHVARTVCRRAERDVVALSQDPEVHDCELLIIYLNRLSDLLFVLARVANKEVGVADQPWKPSH